MCIVLTFFIPVEQQLDSTHNYIYISKKQIRHWDESQYLNLVIYHFRHLRVVNYVFIFQEFEENPNFRSYGV